MNNLYDIDIELLNYKCTIIGLSNEEPLFIFKKNIDKNTFLNELNNNLDDFIKDKIKDKIKDNHINILYSEKIIYNNNNIIFKKCQHNEILMNYNNYSEFLEEIYEIYSLNAEVILTLVKLPVEIKIKFYSIMCNS